MGRPTLSETGALPTRLSNAVAGQWRTLNPTRYLRNVPSAQIRREQSVKPGASKRKVSTI